jgi:hypothetical protein
MTAAKDKPAWAPAEPGPHPERRPLPEGALDVGRDWDGPEQPPKPTRVTIDVETAAGRVKMPARHDPETERAMALEAAGFEVDPATGQYRKASWS